MNSSLSYTVRQMQFSDLAQVEALQVHCFPPPFPSDLLWKSEHLKAHLEKFADGQFVAVLNESNNGLSIIGSASASRISEENWQSHKGWDETLGGFTFETLDPNGSTMYGADISVHPEYRGLKVGYNLYQARFEAVKRLNLKRYGTACRIPDYLENKNKNPGLSVDEYCKKVSLKQLSDRTLSPLLKMGLTYQGFISDYMEDIESANCAALLEWKN